MRFASESRCLYCSFVQAQEACAIAWATNQQILAVGTSKGNLVLYNLARYQKVPIMGKHTRAVACAAWNNTEILAMGATDKQVQYVVLSPANASHAADGRHAQIILRQKHMLT